MILVTYTDDKKVEYKATRVPDEKVNALDRVLHKRKGITIGKLTYPDDLVVGIFSEEEWSNLKKTMLTPQSEKLKAEIRQSDWYIKGKMGIK